MTWFETKSTRTRKSVMVMLSAGFAKAEQLRLLQCIAIADASGELLGEIPEPRQCKDESTDGCV